MTGNIGISCLGATLASMKAPGGTTTTHETTEGLSKMKHGKIHPVLRGKSLPASILLILTAGAAIYCGNSLSFEKEASTPARETSLSLQTLRSVDSQQLTVPKGNSHYTLLVPQPRWIF
ncbi:hypothetical protein [Azotobacter salinestris]|uniref:hypothetical protein n=1 Tax=Azotobacter salinestris TaxID=69964 RepID=UPI00142EBF0F|nr:hypothetical protein [Azotobacter salinestris]